MEEFNFNWSRVKNDAVPFISTMFFGLFAHLFIIGNKIPVNDDLCYMFTKGETTSSGRWGLELLRYILPDYPMPTVYGLMTLVFVALTVCVIVRLFKIKSNILQILIGGLFVAFPALTGIMGYMFTVAPYSVAIFASVYSVYVFERKYRFYMLLSPALLVFSCSIYQGYFGFAASFSIILMIKSVLDNEKTVKEIFFDGIKMLLMLIAAAAVYGISTTVAAMIQGTEILDAINKTQSIVLRIAVAYSAYLHTITRGYFAYIYSPATLCFHLILFAATAYFLIIYIIHSKDIMRNLLLCILLLLFPLSSYCLYILASNTYIHSLALYSFASVYVLMAVVFDKYIPEKSKLCRYIVSLSAGAIIVSNIFFANAFYLQAFLQYENRSSFYTSLMSSIMQEESFSDKSVIALVGNGTEMQYDVSSQFEFPDFVLPGANIMDYVNAGDLLRYYIGWDVKLADEAECSAISETDEFKEMPVYPYHGAVKSIGEYLVIRLS